MIKFKNTVTPSPKQWEAVVHGVRHPYESYDKSDSRMRESFDFLDDSHEIVVRKEVFEVGAEDLKLMQKLSNAGTDHGKFLRMIPVIVDLTAPLYWWKECDQYKIGTVTDSTSTMHCIHKKEFEVSDFSLDGVEFNDGFQTLLAARVAFVISDLNELRELYNLTKDENYWRALIQMLPECYNQTRMWSTNYAVLKNIYHARKDHRLKEWHDMCAWIETLPYAKELILGEG